MREVNQAFWNRYQAIVVAIKEAGLKHPHSADIAAYCHGQKTVEEIVKDWSGDILNRIK